MLVDTGGYVSRLGLMKALKDRGLEPGDIRIVFLSHLHFDHCHNIDLFRHAKVLVSREEWEYAHSPHERDMFMPWGIHDQLARHDLELIEGDGALTNRLRYYPVPGHTPGCYALELDSERHGRVVVAGDAIKYAKEAVSRCCDMAFRHHRIRDGQHREDSGPCRSHHPRAFSGAHPPAGRQLHLAGYGAVRALRALIGAAGANRMVLEPDGP